MQTKKKAVILISAGIAVVLVILATVIILFAAAKPLMLPSFTQHEIGEQYIHSYTFNGMTFAPCNSYVSRNYSDENGSKISNMCNTVNYEIERSLFEYLNESYSSYHINSDISQNGRAKTVITFSGDGVPSGGGEREIVHVDLIIDWTKAIENNGNFIEISA